MTTHGAWVAGLCGLFAMIGVVSSVKSWADVEKSRVMFGERSVVTPTECVPTADACKKALAEECRAEADAGTWEAIPFCHCLDCKSYEELEDAVEGWKKDAGALWEGLGPSL